MKQMKASAPKTRAASGRRSSSARHKSSRRKARALLVRVRLKELGIVLSTDKGRVNDLYNVWIAKAYADVPLPRPWSEYSDEKGRVFYYNHVSGVSKWEHPLFNTFRGLLERSRLEPDLARTGYFKDLYYKLRKYCIQPSSSEEKDKEEGQDEGLQVDESYKGWWTLNLLAATSSKRESGPPPTPEEVKEMCLYLGINLDGESGLAWIAKQAVQAALPPDWYEAEDKEGNNFYFNAKSGESSTSHPLDEYFLALVKSERRNKEKLDQRRQSMLIYTATNRNDKYSGRMLIALFESHWESIRSEWVPFIARKHDTFWYNFETDEKIYLPFWEPRYRIAGRKIVNAWRRYQAYKEKKHKAAVCIQSNYRRHAVQSAILLWQDNCAAVCIQCYVRRWLVQNEIRRNKAAVTIQRAVREYLFMILQQQHVAATVIQSHVRRALAKKEQMKRIALKKKVEARLRIQANMRRIAEQRIKEERRKAKASKTIRAAYLAYRLSKEIDRRIQRKVLLRQKQQEYMRKYRSQVMARKATRIQSMVRGFLVKKELRTWRNAAEIIQSYFRQYLIDRRNRVKQLVHLYYDVHATKIQKQWKRFSYWKSKEEEESAAFVIQRHFRSYLAIKQKQKMLEGIIKIQANWKRWRRWNAFKIEKAQAEQRAYILKRLGPYCHALGITVDYVVDSADKESIDDQVRMLSKLVEKRKNLHLRAMGEIAKVCLSLDTADIHARQQLSIAEKGSPGWLSDESMKSLKSTLKNLHLMRQQNLSKILSMSEAKVRKICDEMRVSENWKQKHLTIDKSLGLDTLDYLDILISRLKSASQLAKSLNPLVNQVKLFKLSLEKKENVAQSGFSKKDFPLVLRTLHYIMAEVKNHRGKDFEDICLMLDLPKFKEIERMQMLVNFHQSPAKQEEKKEGSEKKKSLRRPTLGRSSLFSQPVQKEDTELAEKVNKPLILKKRPKRKKRSSVLKL